MRNRGRSRGAGRRLVGPGAGVDLAHTILTITNGGGFPTVTTAAAHGITDLPGFPNVSITLAGTAGYDGTYSVAASELEVVTATTFNLPLTAYVADSAGGTWNLA